MGEWMSYTDCYVGHKLNISLGKTSSAGGIQMQTVIHCICGANSLEATLKTKGLLKRQQRRRADTIMFEMTGILCQNTVEKQQILGQHYMPTVYPSVGTELTFSILAAETESRPKSVFATSCSASHC